MWLVDTSAWVEFFRRSSRLTLADLAPSPRDIVTCLPVIQEVLQGFDDDRAYTIARTSLLALHAVDTPMTTAAVHRAIEIYRRARRTGVTIRSSVDCLVAASALEHGLGVVHCDRDFAAIARVTGLRHVDLTPQLQRPDA